MNWETDNIKALVQALDHTGMLMFMYDPEKKRVIIPENTGKRYGCKAIYEDMPRSFAEEMVYEGDYPAIYELFHKIDCGEKTASAVFHDKKHQLCIKMTLSAAAWTKEGKIKEVIGFIENKSDSGQNEKFVGQLKNELALQDMNDEMDKALKLMAATIGSQYSAVYYIWLESRTYVCFQEKLQAGLSVIGEKEQYEPAFEAYIKGHVEEQDQKEIREFTDINTLAERIGNKNSITHIYRVKKIGWVRGRFIAAQRDAAGKPTIVLYTVSDINEEMETKQKMAEAENEALHDALTKLWNRKAFEQFKEAEDYKNNQVGFVLLDIDRFKGINDQYGHDKGDQVIIAVADELRSALRQKDLIFRVGGDEFAILLYNCNESMWNTFCSKIERIHSNLKTGLSLELNITLSAGICVNKDGYRDEMYSLADKAMYHTKQNGRAGCTSVSIHGDIEQEWHDTSVFLRKGEILEKNSTVTWRLDKPKKKGLKHRVYGDAVFCAFVGRKPSASPEELYEAWASRVKPDNFDIIKDAAKLAIADGKVEVVFQWNHPEKGWIQLRCSASYEAETDNYYTFIGYIHVITGTHVVTIEDIDARVKKALEEMFYCDFYIRLSDYSFKVYKAQPCMMELLGKSENAIEAVNAYVRYMVADENKEEMTKFLDLTTIKQRLKSRNALEAVYNDPNIGMSRVNYIVVDRDEQGDPETVALVVDSVEQRLLSKNNVQMSAEELLQLQNEAISRLTNSDLIFIAVTNKETGAGRLIQDKSGVEMNHSFDFEFAMKREASHLPVAEQEDFLRKTQLAYINQKLEKNDRYSIPVFRQLPNNGRFRRVSYQFSRNEKFPEYILTTTEDITENYIYDKVTGLKNFDGFRMDCMYEFLRSEPDRYIIINFNIVNFKAVNAMFGYEAGDWLLKNVLISLMKADIPFRSVCRENADNFFCLCRKEDYDDNVMNDLCRMKVGDESGLTETTELVCGVYFINNNEESLDIICDKARIARRQAERKSGINIYILDENDKQHYLDEAVIISSVSKAIQNEEMLIYYQPIYDAQSGKIASAEALVRWKHPERGMLSPDIFIPVIERTGQITEIDMYVGRYVQKFQRERFLSGRKMVPISINVSRYDFLQENYMKQALSAMQDNQMIANMVRIEITESGLISIPSNGENFMNEMRGLGIQTMIDDFGTGYSSLASIADRPCDIIKLDMTFAGQIGIEKKMEVLIRAAIETAHHLNVKVVAEGVETQEQFCFLKDIGCDYIQGYYFSKPLPQEEFEVLLDESL